MTKSLHQPGDRVMLKIGIPAVIQRVTPNPEWYYARVLLTGPNGAQVIDLLMICDAEIQGGLDV